MQFNSIDAAAPASFAWSNTALGEPAQWPHSLRLSVDILLNSPLASVLMWGPEQVMVYNDAYVALLGSKHMAAPGAKVPAMLPAEWSWNSAALESAWAGRAACYRGQALQIWRDGAASEQLLDLYYTPIRDELGAVRGVLCAAAPATAAARGAGSGAGARPLRILVVEDNPDAQFLVCEMLQAFGHQVQAVGTGEDAAGLLAASTFDVLFTDVSLPGISGVELARQALRGQPGLRIMFASGFGDALTRHVEFAAVALQKPYDMEHLRSALESISRDLATAAPPG